MLKNKESSYLMYLDANNLSGQVMSQQLPVNGFVWVEQLSEFHEHFIKHYDENNDKGHILEADAEYPKNVFNLHSDLPFQLKERKLKNAGNFFVTYITKKTMLYTQEP